MNPWEELANLIDPPPPPVNIVQVVGEDVEASALTLTSLNHRHGRGGSDELAHQADERLVARLGALGYEAQRATGTGTQVQHGTHGTIWPTWFNPRPPGTGGHGAGDSGRSTRRESWPSL